MLGRKFFAKEVKTIPKCLSDVSYYQLSLPFYPTFTIFSSVCLCVGERERMAAVAASLLIT